MTEVGVDVARPTDAPVLAVKVLACAGLGVVAVGLLVKDSDEVVPTAKAVLTATGFCSLVGLVPISTGAVACPVTGAVADKTVCDESPTL